MLKIILSNITIMLFSFMFIKDYYLKKNRYTRPIILSEALKEDSFIVSGLNILLFRGVSLASFVDLCQLSIRIFCRYRYTL